LARDDARWRAFNWDNAQAELALAPAECGTNIGFETVDRHVLAGRAEQIALRLVSDNGSVHTVAYEQLREATCRFARALESLHVLPGELVFSYLPKSLELFVACLGTLKYKGAFSPLFSAFGPEPVAKRVNKGQGRVLVTTEALFNRKIAKLCGTALPSLRHIVLTQTTSRELPHTIEGVCLHRWEDLLSGVSAQFDVPLTGGSETALVHFTSGTTGEPKGAMHVHDAIYSHVLTARWALDLQSSDVFWCTADPGWVTGTSYGIVAPLACGVTSVVDEGEFDIDRWYSIIANHRVSVWYTSPTAIRMMMRAGTALARSFDLSSLRLVASVGEPLNPEAIRWSIEAFGLPIHDNWWQTETGGIMIANVASMPIKLGSMGKPLPGIHAAIVATSDFSSVPGASGARAELEPGQVGELAIRPGWPSMFRGYLGEAKRYDACFHDGWYLTGDLAKRDADGYFWFVGRSDDVIKSAGHLIGPFEVESTLLEHPAVAEAAVIGVPDALVGEQVQAWVSVKPGTVETPELAQQLIGFARQRLGAAVAPKKITWITTLPRTRSGKIMRRLLRAQVLGLPLGDTSTLEVAP